jgi:hypothetical protein
MAMSTRAHNVVSVLLENDPDAPDSSYLKLLPDQTGAAMEFVLDAVAHRITVEHDDWEIHRQYALILREAIKQFGKPVAQNYSNLFAKGMYEISVYHAGAAYLPADDAAEIYGDLLVDVRVNTEAAGEYPGGPATIIQVQPDPEAPEIVFQVSNPAYEEGEIGVFSHESIEFL